MTNDAAAIPAGTRTSAGTPDAQQLPPSWETISPGPHDVRLVVCDMDGTLLTDAGEFPDGFWELEDELRARDILFVPASGRQYQTLQHMFPGQGFGFIAENGSLVARGTEILDLTPVDQRTVADVVDVVRGAGEGVEVILSGAHAAYTESSVATFRAEASKYYAELLEVEDLLAVEDEIIKIASFDLANSDALAANHLNRFRDGNQVVIASPNWVDVMASGVDKGTAVRALQERTGITPAQTVIFGDYLNDLGMMGEGEFSFAMANSHPDIFPAARYVAPSNQEDGVVRVLRRLLGL